MSMVLSNNDNIEFAIESNDWFFELETVKIKIKLKQFLEESRNYDKNKIKNSGSKQQFK